MDKSFDASAEKDERSASGGQIGGVLPAFLRDASTILRVIGVWFVATSCSAMMRLTASEQLARARADRSTAIDSFALMTDGAIVATDKTRIPRISRNSSKERPDFEAGFSGEFMVD